MDVARLMGSYFQFGNFFFTPLAAAANVFDRNFLSAVRHWHVVGWIAGRGTFAVGHGAGFWNRTIVGSVDFLFHFGTELPWLAELNHKPQTIPRGVLPTMVWIAPFTRK